MNYLKASSDHRVGPHHVSVYMALFQEWCINDLKNPFYITPVNLRQVAKVGRTTYHKCMRELHEYGYILYTPSYSPALKSMVHLVELDR